MSLPADYMELREDEIRKHYPAAAGMLEGIDHTPRIARPKVTGAPRERSPGVGLSGRRFRSTTPGLVTRSTARPEGVHLAARIEGTDGEHFFVVETPEAFAHRVLQLLSSPALMKGMGLAARRWVEETYAWPGAVDRLESIYENLLKKENNKR